MRRPSEKYTAERVEIMRRDWPTARNSLLILADVNALLGPRITFLQLGVYCAQRLYLRRPGRAA